MPQLSRCFVRAALLYLAAGFTLGALLLSNKGLAYAPWLWRLRPTHIEFLVYGWTVQLMLGVAFWILPRFRGGRGHLAPAWAAFVLLNTGIVLCGLAPALAGPAWLGLAGRAAQAAAVLAFAVHAWPRVKAAGV